MVSLGNKPDVNQKKILHNLQENFTDSSAFSPFLIVFTALLIAGQRCPNEKLSPNLNSLKEL